MTFYIVSECIILVCQLLVLYIISDGKGLWRRKKWGKKYEKDKKQEN